MFLKRRRTESIEFLLDRIGSKLAGWKPKSLFWAARTTYVQIYPK